METKAPKEGGNLTILVLGDESVGKSSLVSTFVSRHFSELVPPIITRVRIPPDAQLANCTSTIIDTQEGDVALSDALSLSNARLGSRGSLASISADSISSWDKKNTDEQILVSSTKRPPAAALLAAGSPFRNVDAIILVYDLDRSETFDRLSSHWLPLIDKCYDGDMPVIIAGNKMDLQSSSAMASASTDNQHITGSRQDIISLLKQFMFVRQCIKCSAKNLLNIDEVFKKAQQAVLYPINPLYDLNTGRLTAACTRALSRIFRIFDKDSDGLLSDAELNAFQQEVWGVTLMERDVSSWKKVVVEHDSFSRMGDEASGESAAKPVLREGKFTLQGFLTIFDVFISQNRLEVPWKVLRSFGHADDLNLVIPSTLSECDDFTNIVVSKWRLSDEEKSFLANLFDRYDSDKDGVLATDETRKVFSVLSNPLPPWSERGKGLFDGCPSLPRIENEGTSPSSSMIGVPFDTALEMSPLPTSTQESSPDSPSMLSASGITISSSPLPSVDVSKDTTPPSGSLGLRPISFLMWMNHWHMLCIVSPSVFRLELYRLGYVCNVTPKDVPGSSACRMQTKQGLPRVVAPGFDIPSLFVRALVIGGKSSGSDSLIRKLHGESNAIDTMLDHPETSCSVSKLLLPKHSSKNDAANVETAVHLIITHVLLNESPNSVTDEQEKLVTLLQEGVYDMAVLVYNSPETFNTVKSFDKAVMNYKMPKIFVSTAPIQESAAIDYCEDNRLEVPCVTDVDQSQLDPTFIEYLIRYVQKPRRNTSKRRKLLWLGGLVTAGITVVIGLTIGRKKNAGNDKGWFKCLLDLVSF
ncbi:hypothetical protein ACHAWO_012865 [Cyclotella atomus]|uniref:EF-hand domain-containing protein n=1 Tax=Cyclotella atomus TaxID=382360 RepID=A0ABD3P6J2_9STRA